MADILVKLKKISHVMTNAVRLNAALFAQDTLTCHSMKSKSENNIIVEFNQSLAVSRSCVLNTMPD